MSTPTTQESVFTLVVKHYVYAGKPEDRTEDQRKIHDDMEVMTYSATGTIDNVLCKTITSMISMLVAVHEAQNGNAGNYWESPLFKSLVRRYIYQGEEIPSLVTDFSTTST